MQERRFQATFVIVSPAIERHIPRDALDSTDVLCRKGSLLQLTRNGLVDNSRRRCL